ncbi:MAG TPA: molybdate ABC transporter substrate-binding protein [Candidatus Deferrimicrobium sp.]|nr:molybdate ABC transporter substrate-binding protein [Candidatus Deferrimicrobium sp.]
MRVACLVTLSLLLMISLTGCGTAGNNPKELTVSAAASLKDSLTEIQKKYLQKNPGIKLTFNFAASGTLQQQIEQGAPVDLFISASKTQVDALEQKNLLIKESRVDLLGNELVLVVGKDNTDITSIRDLTKASVGKISIGTPGSVPAGKYAQEALTKLNLWDTLQPKMVLAAKDVTQVLNYIEAGNVDAGFVYRSDALKSNKVKVIEVVPASSHQPIVYPAAIVASTKNMQETKDFIKYLQSSEVQQVFKKYGFQILER